MQWLCEVAQRPDLSVRFPAIADPDHANDIGVFKDESDSPVSGAEPVVPLSARKELYVAGAGRGKACNGVLHQVSIADLQRFQFADRLRTKEDALHLRLRICS